MLFSLTHNDVSVFTAEPALYMICQLLHAKWKQTGMFAGDALYPDIADKAPGNPVLLEKKHAAGLESRRVACRVAAADIPISYDKLLEGQTATYEVVDTVIEELNVEAKFKDKGLGSIEERALLTPRDALFSLEKRQYCNPGYGYCDRLGGCCPSSNKCCSWGYCLEPGKECCPEGPCDVGEECCGYSHCMPEGAECCTDESYCERGNHCYIFYSSGIRRCCTNSQCTAVVDGGTTSYASTSTTTKTYTSTMTQYYYWTITWYYYVYYWTLSVQIDAYIVTSTRTTETTTLSVFTTASSAASEYFSSVSETLSLPTPASATSLESLAGSTSYTGPTGPTGPSKTAGNVPKPTDPDDSDKGDNDDSGSDSNSDENGGGNNSGNNSDNNSGSNSGSNSGGSDGGSEGNSNNGDSNGDSNGNPPSGGARALWAGVDGGVLAWATFGTSVGILAVVL